MRVLFGMILGAMLTVLGAYVYDSGSSDTERRMVNWDVVSENWQAAKSRVQREWTQISQRINS